MKATFLRIPFHRSRSTRSSHANSVDQPSTHQDVHGYATKEMTLEEHEQIKIVLQQADSPPTTEAQIVGREGEQDKPVSPRLVDRTLAFTGMST